MEALPQTRTVPAPAEGQESAGRPPSPEKLFEEYAPRVYSLARRLLGNEADAEDVTQDVFLQIIRKLPTFRGDAAFSTWLYRVAVNAALTYRRKRALRQTAPLGERLEDFGEDGNHRAPVRRWVRGPEQQALDREAQERIERAIAGLPEIYRDVYVLADLEELPNAEVAELLGVSVAAAKSRLHRARLLLRKALAPYFEEQAA
jgi:RNA polymerase sigma-70 factor (ECF subfamily)